jgi:signal recognition particle receptor subunit beta
MYVDWRHREVFLKIVYYGPPHGGKSSSLQVLHDELAPLARGKYVSLEAVDDPNLLFDFFAVELGNIQGKKVVFNLYGVPGDLAYVNQRRLTLNGVDGIVFVADSRPTQISANAASLDELESNLKRLGCRLANFPLVFQFNKRDLADALPVSKLHSSLNKIGAPFFETVATQGLGLGMTFHAIADRVSASVIHKLSRGRVEEV